VTEAVPGQGVITVLVVALDVVEELAEALHGSHRIEAVSTGGEALHVVAHEWVDVVVTGLALPDMDGVLFCRLLRSVDAGVSIIAIATDGSRIQAASDVGADDFVLGSFSAPGSEVAELVLRVAGARRRESDGQADAAPPTGLELSEDDGTVWFHGRPVALTKTEFTLLRELTIRPGRVISRDTLLANVWGYDASGGDRLVDAHIWRLRRKLAEGGEPHGIATLRGFGYKYVGHPISDPVNRSASIDRG